MNTETKILISTNRIYFEQFPTKCGDIESKEIEREFDSALKEAIETAGFKSQLSVGFGYGPGINATVIIYGVACAWHGRQVTELEIDEITSRIADVHEEWGTSNNIKELLKTILPPYCQAALQTASDAIDKAFEAAMKMSDSFFICPTLMLGDGKHVCANCWEKEHPEQQLPETGWVDSTCDYCNQ